jgi:FixJ family two-component response regulator
MDRKPIVQIIEDDPFASTSLARLLASVSLETRQYVSPPQFLQDFNPADPGCILIDLRLPA